ncbi:PAS domain-containing protein [Salmonella enterica subsp. enterica]|nr:PAS domain-containing protein [Salmonella enterica subsp. enterica serovar Abony]
MKSVTASAVINPLPAKPRRHSTQRYYRFAPDSTGERPECPTGRFGRDFRCVGRSAKLSGLQVQPSILKRINEPWGIKDKESRYVYANKAYFDFLDVPIEKRNKIHLKSYDFIPSLQPLIKGLVSHDQEVMNTGERYEAVGTLLINGNYRTFLFEKWPRFSSTGEINGTIFHLKPFEQISMSYFIDKPFYGKATYSPPTEIFSPREWDVLFLLFRRIEKRQISKIYF